MKVATGLHSVVCGNRSFTPSKIVCVGRNYVGHIQELGNQVPEELVVFIKPNSAISPNLRAFSGEALHFEGELCFLFDHDRFAAVGFGFDLTKRALQTQLKEQGLPWARAKAFDGSAVLSPFVEISEASGAFSFDLQIQGKNVQSGSVDLMIHKPLEILKEIQTFMSLNDGDIVMTGTPQGVAEVQMGDKFSVLLKQENQLLLEHAWAAC